MSGNDSEDSNHGCYDDVDWIVMDGVEYLGQVAHPFTESSRKLPLYEMSVKEMMEGNASSYPLHEDFISDSSISKSFSDIPGNLKHLTDTLKAGKGQSQSFSEVKMAKPNIDELQRVISAAEAHISSLKAKVKEYIRKETCQNREGSPELLEELMEVKEKSESESSSTDLSDEVTVLPRPESTESESESSGDENGQCEPKLSNSSKKELSRVKKCGRLLGRQAQRSEQSPNKGISFDNSYAELEIHSGLHGSSNVKGKICIRERCIYDEFKTNPSRDTKRQQSSRKTSCCDAEEESPGCLHPSGSSEKNPTLGSQRSLESETAESSLYQTAEEMSSQTSDLFSHSGESDSS